MRLWKKLTDKKQNAINKCDVFVRYFDIYERKKYILATVQSEEWIKLSFTVGLDRYFYFDGQNLCLSVLSTVFRYSSDMQTRNKRT